MSSTAAKRFGVTALLVGERAGAAGRSEASGRAKRKWGAPKFSWQWAGSVTD